ncbi:MAG: hypothetical protein ACKOAS_01325 [Verrucomicrobiota bacterium]|jgi:uncharacterized protein YbaR (Trm112 family)
MHANEYSDVFVCPTTRKRLRIATDRELEALRLREGLEKLENAWIRADRAVAYPVVQGIPLLTSNNAIFLRKSRTIKKSANP